MRVLVIGSGGREHALAVALAKSSLVDEIYVAPGNGGTGNIAKNVPLAVDDIEALVNFASDNQVGLVVVGPELPLTLGIADRLQSRGIACFGPDAYCARLEGSKSFAKELMARAGVPTAKSEVFATASEAKNYARQLGEPPVIKADGLAAGKGVVVAQSLEEALAAIDAMFDGSLLDKPAASVLVEERLVGEEVSLLCLCDGVHAAPLPSAQDHKAVFDGDAGPNTGGMGAYSPAPILPDSDLEAMADRVIRPILRELAQNGHPFRGVLYAGLMLTAQGPKVLEYNVRFGDPECQAILPRLESDLAAHMLACAAGRLPGEELRFSPRSALGVVLAAQGYPGKYGKGYPIEGVADAEKPDNVRIYHAGTIGDGPGLKSAGGRVLCVTALGDSLQEAQRDAYAALEKIKMPQGHFRRDIGARGIKRLRERGRAVSGR